MEKTSQIKTSKMKSVRKTISRMELLEKRQKKVIEAIGRMLNDNVERRKAQEKLQQEKIDEQKSRFDIFNTDSEGNNQTNDELFNQQLGEKLEELNKLHEKQRKCVKRLKKHIKENNINQKVEEDSTRGKAESLRIFLKRVGDAFVKALPKLLDTTVNILANKLFGNIKIKRGRLGIT